jgi:hypothetical protein
VGQPLRGRVAVHLTNSGSATIAGRITTELFLNSDGASTLLGTVDRAMTIRKGKTAAVFFAIKSVSIPAGQGYALQAEVTDPVGNGNTASTAVSTPFVTFTAAVPAVRPAVVRPGRAASLTLEIQNTGNVASIGVANIQIEVFAVGGATSPVFTVPLLRKVKIAAGRRVALNLRFKIPASLAAGTYSPVVQFSLDGQTVSSPIQADFRVT